MTEDLIRASAYHLAARSASRNSPGRHVWHLRDGRGELMQWLPPKGNI